MTVRAMQKADIGAVMAIADALPFAPHWPAASYETVLDTAAARSRVALVAEGAGELAGFAIASLLPPESELESIAVSPEYQHRGIARSLLQALFAACAEYGCREMILEVRESNRPAQALYEAAGFLMTGRRPGYYASPAEDALMFRRQIEHIEK